MTTPTRWVEYAEKALRRRQPAEPTCDYCDEGDEPKDGWHLVYTDEYDIMGTARIPCPRNP